VNGPDEVIELICTAAVHLQTLEADPGIRAEVSHSLAISAETASANSERKAALFAYVIVSSIATNSVGALERLIAGKHFRDYRQYVQKWRNRIDRNMGCAAPWLAGRLRRIKCVLNL
jgi:hypothetical protein